jgi:hypothetical protein
MRLRVAVTLGLLGAATGLPSAASANIVAGQGIAGVTLGMTQAEVEGVTGAPTLKEPPDFEGNVAWKYATGFEGAVGFNKALVVDGMWTDSKSQKTSKGIGPFSSYAKFKKAYPKLKCEPGPWNPKLSLDCPIKGSFGGKPVVTRILFYTKAMGVREVEVEDAS